MRGILLIAKAVTVALKFAAAAAKKEQSAPAAPRAANTHTDELLDMVTTACIDMVEMEHLRLRLNDNGEEYTAVIKSYDIPQDIAVPSTYNGLPVTEVRWESADRHDNKVRLFIPETVKKLDLNVLWFSSSGKRGRWLKLIIDERNPYLVTENRCVYSKDKTVLWCALCKTNYVTVPDTVREIAAHAFTGNMYTVGVKLPPSVKVIGKGAFEYCENLRSINLENVESIGAQACMNCEKIRELIFKKLHDIGDKCFYGCKYIFKIKLPVTLAVIGSNVFRTVQYIELFDNLKAPLRSFLTVAGYVTVRSAESGNVKYKVCMDKYAPPQIIELHRYGWREYAGFDLEKHDRLFEGYCTNHPAYAGFFSITALFRLGYPYKLTDHAREYYIKWLKEHSGHVLYGGIDTEIKDFSALFSERIRSPRELALTIELLDEGKEHELKALLFEMIEEFCRERIYCADDILELIDCFSANGKTEYTARLLELRNALLPYGGDELTLE
ncbi:MAG: leucine-rich repeat domain-containing protein [Oscillospiraceae bacterium]|nr:leucine-rich repeat domain-containing protein [Oscillospiraceae bacterium]